MSYSARTFTLASLRVTQPSYCAVGTYIDRFHRRRVEDVRPLLARSGRPCPLAKHASSAASDRGCGAYPGARAVVFEAFTDAGQLAMWWGPEGFSVPSLRFNPRGGGRYRIEMQPPQGDAFWLAGEFRVVDPPAHLAFTFGWEDPDPDDLETLVDLRFRRLDGSRLADVALSAVLRETRGWRIGGVLGER